MPPTIVILAVTVLGRSIFTAWPKTFNKILVLATFLDGCVHVFAVLPTDVMCLAEPARPMGTIAVFVLTGATGFATTHWLTRLDVSVHPQSAVVRRTITCGHISPVATV